MPIITRRQFLKSSVAVALAPAIAELESALAPFIPEQETWTLEVDEAKLEALVKERASIESSSIIDGRAIISVALDIEESDRESETPFMEAVKQGKIKPRTDAPDS